MNNKEKIIKCRVKSDSTFTDLVGYELYVIRDKAFYKIDDVVPLDGDFDEKSESLFQKYYGFLIGREELDLNVYDHRKELAETFKGFKEGGAYSPIDKVDTSNPPKTDFTETNLMKCRVNKEYMYYDTLKDLDLYVTPIEERKGYYMLEHIDISSFKGDQNEWDKLIKNYRVGRKEEPFHIPEKYLDFQIIYNEKTSPSKETGTGAVREFESGAIRDVDGKEDYVETQSFLAMKRYAEYMTVQAKKYGRGNWRKGIPIEEYEKSLMRHIHKYFANKYDNANLEPEIDHLSAIRFNLDGIIHEEEKLKLKQVE